MKSKLMAAVAAVALALGGVAALAAPASAHTGGVVGVASCEADGTYTVTWTYTATNVPAGKEAETKAMTTTPGTLAPIDGVDKGGQIFLSVWTEHQVNVPGAPVKTGNWSAKFKTVGIPGTFSGDVTTMVQTDWKDGPSEDPVGKVGVDGGCKPPVVQPPVPPLPEPKVTITYTEWEGGQPSCAEPQVTQTRTKTTSTIMGGWTWDGISDHWTLVEDEPVVEVVTETRQVRHEGSCSTPTPTPTPTPTLTPTPTPTPTEEPFPSPTPTATPTATPQPTSTATAAPVPTGAKLPATGGEAAVVWTAGALGAALLALGTVLAVRRRRS